jgi:hypothetical protein
LSLEQQPDQQRRKIREGKEEDMSSQENKPFEKPTIATYTEDEILDLLGPANTAGSPFFGDFHGNGHGPGNGHGHGHGRH